MANTINSDIVKSARIFGQWLNQTAHSLADRDVEVHIEKREEKINCLKSKLLKQMETDIINSLTPQDMIFRTTMRAVKMSEQDVPSKATRFIDAVNSGKEIHFDEAKQILMIYLRLESENSD